MENKELSQEGEEMQTIKKIKWQMKGQLTMEKWDAFTLIL